MTLRYGTYLFDLDGTLLDSIELIVASFRHTADWHAERTGTPAPPEATWTAGIGRTLREQLGILARTPEELDALVETYVAWNLAEHDARVRPYPGAVETVRALERQGARLALVTGKMRRGAGAGLRVLGLEDAFPLRVCGDDVTQGKPHPESVHKALDALGVPASDAVFVGDSPHDMGAGRAAGVATAAARWGPFADADLATFAPTHWLDDLPSLLRL